MGSEMCIRDSGVAVNAGADAEVIGGKSDIDQRAGFAVQFVVGGSRAG